MHNCIIKITHKVQEEMLVVCHLPLGQLSPSTNKNHKNIYIYKLTMFTKW